MRSASANKSNDIDEEVADFEYDLRLARRWKRRRIANQSFKLRAPKKTINNNNNNNVVCKEEVVDFQLDSCSNGKENINNNNNNDEDDDDDNDGNVGVEEVEADADYEMFLNGIGSYSDGEAEGDARCEDNNDDDDDNENGDGDLDPQYMMFLSKLKVDGTSYVLEVPLNVDISGFLKYDIEDGSCDGHKSKDLGVTENCPMRENKKSQRILRSVSRRMKIENLEVLNDVLEKQNIESPRTLRSVSRKESMKAKKNLSEVRSRKRTSPMFEKNVKVEAAEKQKIESPRTLRSVSRKESMTTKKNLSDVRSRKRTSPRFEKNVKVEAAIPVSCQTKERTTKRPSPERFRSAKQECNRNVKCDMVDECYQVFLSCLKKVGKNMVYMPQGGKQVVYEEDVESASDSEVIAMDYDPYSGGNCTPFVASDSFMAGPGRSSQSQFREKLMEYLKKPYDDEEYKNLWEELSRQRPKKRHRDLRYGRGRSCSLNSPGKSYFDFDRNLVAKIKSAGLNRRKILYLLRGYDYWLQNKPNDESFLPWTDPLCLKVLSQL